MPQGAHAEELLRDPDPADVRKLIDAAPAPRAMVTLATELPGGMDSVRLLAEHGVIAAIGHTDATYEQTRQAIEAGATVATHLFNAMPALGHRAPGPIAALLEDERITVELINDGTHLHPAVLQLAFHHAGADRVAFITDAMGAAGMATGRYPLGPMEVEVTDGVARAGRRAVRSPAPPSPWTAPSSGPSRSTACGRGQAVPALSANPARLLGMDDRIGSLEPGKDADLVVLDAGLRPQGRDAPGRMGGAARRASDAPHRAAGGRRPAALRPAPDAAAAGVQGWAGHRRLWHDRSRTCP